MMTKEQLEKIAKRYGIKVSHVKKENGGFILDDSKKIVKSMFVSKVNNALIENLESNNDN